MRLEQHGDAARAGGFEASIPAEVLSGVHPVQYYFEIVGADESTLYPGLADTLDNQPYFVIRRTGGGA